MRMLWLSFLLIGHITCGPVGQDYISNSADPTSMQEPYSSGYWYSGTGMSSGPGSSSPLPSLTNPSFDKPAELPAQDVVYYSPGSYSSTNMASGEGLGGGYAGYAGYNSLEIVPYGAAYASSPYNSGAPAGSYTGGYGSSAGSYGGYGSSAGAYGGYGSYVYEPAPGEGSFGSAGQGAGGEVPEPVFSDVSDLDPVYSFNSRSNYQRRRAMFAQTRYTPGEPVAPPMPVSKRVSKTTSKQRSPAKDAKGRYH